MAVIATTAHLQLLTEPMKIAPANIPQPSSGIRLIPVVLIFLFGFVVGGSVTVVLLGDQITAAWVASAQLSTSPNMPLHNLLDEVARYLVVYRLIFLLLIVVSIGWKFLVANKLNSQSNFISKQ